MLRSNPRPRYPDKWIEWPPIQGQRPVVPTASFREGQVTFFSSILTSRRNCLALVDEIGLCRHGLCPLGRYLNLAFLLYYSWRHSGPGTSLRSLITDLAELAAEDFRGTFVELFPFFFFDLAMDYGLILIRQICKNGRPGGIRTPITRIWSPVL